MQDADAFDEVVFLGMARSAKRDPYRLSLFGAHLDSGDSSSRTAASWNSALTSRSTAHGM